MSQKPTSDVKRHIRSYGRRKTKGLRSTRAEAMDNVLPRVQIELPAGVGAIDTHSFFDSKADSHFSFSRYAGEGRDEGVSAAVPALPTKRSATLTPRDFCRPHPHPALFPQSGRGKISKTTLVRNRLRQWRAYPASGAEQPRDIGSAHRVCEPFMNGAGSSLCSRISGEKKH